MPKQEDRKRRVRARMEKTGESDTPARVRQLEKPRGGREATPRERWIELAGMSDEAVEAKTGRTWAGWVRELDRIDATRLEHREIARWLAKERGLPAWWAQTVTVGYERIRGLRHVGQRRGGGYDANKSKTVPVPLAELYAAFGARRRARWLGDVDLRISKATRERSIRAVWHDGTRVELHFTAKGAAKSQVQLQHRGFADKASAERARALWTERLAALSEHLKA